MTLTPILPTMKTLLALCVLCSLCGCELFRGATNPQQVDWYDRTLGDRDGLRGYRVRVEVSEPGSRIEVNGEHVTTLTNTTGEIILWADANGTFRDNHVTVIKAYPVHTNQFVQKLEFSSRPQRTYVPHAIYFNLSLDTFKPVERIETKSK